MIGGVVSVAAGVLVWRGSRPVTLVALTILGGLFVAQVSLLILGESGDDEAVGRLLVTGVLAALLVLAALKSRRRP
jgi:peptidoglycan/LPS O-acetylase OafA/YrhL